MLSKRDIEQIGAIIEEKTSIHVTSEELSEKISHLPTKDEFYKTMDEIIGELKLIRGEQAAMHSSYEDHEERIEELEKQQVQSQSS